MKSVVSSAPEKRRGGKERLMKKADIDRLTKDQEAELEALEGLPDDQVDTTDIPEILDWSEAKRGVFYRPVKQQVTLRLDADRGGPEKLDTDLSG